MFKDSLYQQEKNNKSVESKAIETGNLIYCGKKDILWVLKKGP